MRFRYLFFVILLCNGLVAVEIDARHRSPTPVPTTTPAPTPTPTAAPFSNGGFDTGGFSPWTVSGNAHVSHYTTAHSGTYFCSFNDGQASPTGVISQSVATVAGVRYTLSFWQGVEAYNQTAAQSIKVAVIGSGVTLASGQYSSSVTAGASVTVSWVPRSVVFTANSSVTILRFSDVSTNLTWNTDLLLDEVKLVASPTPTPSPTATPTPPPPTPTPTPVVTPTLTPTPAPTASATPVLPMTLGWDAAPSPVAGYRVLYWLASDGKILFVNAGAPTYLTFSTLPSGVWKFVVCGTGVDQNAGCITPPSNEVSLAVP